jgi:hypothetical protein
MAGRPPRRELAWPSEDEIDEGATIAEIEALLGELVAELEG